MKRLLSLFVLVIIITTQSLSQSIHKDTISINNIKALIRVGGVQFWEGDTSYIGSNNEGEACYFYPNGSKKTTVFCSSLWIAGYDVTNNLRIAAERYNQKGTDFWRGPLTTDGTASTNINISNNWDKVWKVNKQDLINYLYSSSYPSNPPAYVLNWPAHGDTLLHQSYQLAPFVDMNHNGKYEPYLGDYPRIYGDQCFFFIINDSKLHIESGGLPIGAEIHVFAYAFNNPSDSALYNSIFYKYKIINRSTLTLHDCYLGLFTDIDIGYAFDDYVACDVERSTYYGYNGKPVDGAGQYYAYDSFPPAQGVTILGGPFMNNDGLDNPIFDNNGYPLCDYSVNGLNFGDGIVDNERLGMCRFVYYINSHGNTGEPENTIHYYNYLSGFWHNGVPLSWGGTGYDVSFNNTARFMFPGLTDTLNWGTGCGIRLTPNDWSEETCNNYPADRRGLASMGKFIFPAGSTQYLDVCYTTATSYNAKSTSVDILKQRIDHLKGLFVNQPEIFQGYTAINENKTNNEKVKFYPNPVITDLFVENVSDKNSKYEIFNMVGNVVLNGNLAAINKQKIDVSELKQGFYIVKIFNFEKIIVQKFVKK